VATYLHPRRFTLGRHDDDNVLMSPSCAFYSLHPCFVQKTSLVSTFFFHHSTILHTHTMVLFFPLLYNPTYTLHYLAFASSHRCTPFALYLIFVSSHCCCVLLWFYIFKFHHASSTSLGCFFIVSTCFTSLCFSLLCSFLFVHGDHHPRGRFVLL
jgi:hypothetical protein